MQATPLFDLMHATARALDRMAYTASLIDLKPPTAPTRLQFSIGELHVTLELSSDAPVWDQPTAHRYKETYVARDADGRVVARNQSDDPVALGALEGLRQVCAKADRDPLPVPLRRPPPDRRSGVPK